MAELPPASLHAHLPATARFIHLEPAWLPFAAVVAALSGAGSTRDQQQHQRRQVEQRSGHRSGRSFFTMHRNVSVGSTGCQDRSNCPLLLARFHARVQVQLRPSVLDPAGEATRAAAGRLGVAGLQSLRIGKAVELSLDAESEAQAREQVQLLCDRLLANPVTENWTMSLEERKA